MEKHVALIVDLENFLYPIRNDEIIFNSRKRVPEIGRITARALVECAALYGLIPPSSRFGAISLPSHDSMGTKQEELQKTLEIRSHAWEWAQAFIDGEHFSIIVVPQGFNAADGAIDSHIIRSILKNGLISTVVIATGDGRDPFPRIVREIAGKNKKVHVALYDTVPFALQESNLPCTYSRLAPIIHEYAEKEGSVSELPERKRSPSYCYSKAARAIRQGVKQGTEPYFSHASLALTIFENIDIAQTIIRLLPGKIAGLLQSKFETFGISIDFDTALQLTYGLIRADIFEKKESVYTYRQPRQKISTP